MKTSPSNIAMVFSSPRANAILLFAIRVHLGIAFVRALVRAGTHGETSLSYWLLAVPLYLIIVLVGDVFIRTVEPHIKALMGVFAEMLVLGLLASGTWRKLSLFATEVTAGILATFHLDFQQSLLAWLHPAPHVPQQSQRRHPLTESYAPRHGAYILHPLTQSLLFFG